MSPLSGDGWVHFTPVIATDGRERIVGYCLAPLQTWMKVLILDKGYWGAEYLMNLHRTLGVHLVTPARDGKLEVVNWIETALPDATWREQHEVRSRLGRITVKLTAVPDVL